MLAVERQVYAQTALVFVKRILTPDCKDRAVLDNRLGSVGRHAHGDHPTQNAGVPLAVLKKELKE